MNLEIFWNRPGIGVLLRKWQKLQLYYWLTSPQVASVVDLIGGIPAEEASDIHHRKAALPWAQEKILSNQIDC